MSSLSEPAAKADAMKQEWNIKVITFYKFSVTDISFLHGGYAPFTSGSASHNLVNVYGGSIYHIHAGHAGSSGRANYNTLNFYYGDVSDLTGAGYVSSGEANYNTLNIYGGTLNGTTQGGYVIGSGDALGNKVNIYGGTITGNILGGYVGGSGNVQNNSINIYGSPDLSSANIYAGQIGTNTSLYGSNNALNIYTKGITARNIGGFDHLNFFLPSNTTNGDTILTLTSGSTDLSNTTVNLSTAGGSKLKTGDSFTLLQNSNGISISNVTNKGTISEGISLDYGLTIPELEGTTSSNSLEDVTNTNRITAVVGELVSGGLKKQANLLPLTPIASVIMANQMHDLTSRWLPPEEYDEDDNEIAAQFLEMENDFKIFANADFTALKTKTGNGSYVKTRSGAMDLGWAKSVVSENGNKLYFAPLFDYGAGNYNSYLSDGTHGHGTSNYFAGGFLFRKTNKKSGFYYEGSARIGHSRSNFSSDDFVMGDTNVHLSYSLSAPIYAGHIHLGRFYPINRENTFQVYGQYFHTHQGSMHTHISTGEKYNFDAVNSGRFRTGVRLIRQLPNKKNIFYSGLAFQYEFNGDSTAHYRGYDTREQSMKGASGMIELGWQLKPTKKSPVMVDLSATGWIGYHKGITCQAKFKRAF